MKITLENHLYLQFLIFKSKIIKSNYAKCSTIPAVLFFGEKGGGKTTLARALQSMLNVPSERFIEINCHKDLTKDELITDINVSAVVRKSAGEVVEESLERDGFLIKAVKLSKEGIVILLIDEIDKASHDIEAFFYSFLQEFCINLPHQQIQGVKSNVFVVFTSNDFRKLAEPIYSRLIVKEVFSPDVKEMTSRILSNYLEINKPLSEESIFEKMGDFTPEKIKLPSEKFISAFVSAYNQLKVLFQKEGFYFNTLREQQDFILFVYNFNLHKHTNTDGLFNLFVDFFTPHKDERETIKKNDRKDVQSIFKGLLKEIKE